MVIRQDLQDPHVYIFSRWVLDLVEKHPKMKSIRNELIPFLAKRQFTPPSRLTEFGSSVFHQCLAVFAYSGPVCESVRRRRLPAVCRRAPAEQSVFALHSGTRPVRCIIALVFIVPFHAVSMVVADCFVHAADLIRCCVYLAKDSEYCARLDSITAYAKLNRDVRSVCLPVRLVICC